MTDRMAGVFQGPEVQTMYSLNMPVSQIRTKMRQEFERHRYVQQLHVVDVLIFQSHSEFQVWDCNYEYDGSTMELILTLCKGNSQLLETALAYYEVLQDRRDAECEAAEQFHGWILGGLSHLPTTAASLVRTPAKQHPRGATRVSLGKKERAPLHIARPMVHVVQSLRRESVTKTSGTENVVSLLHLLRKLVPRVRECVSNHIAQVHQIVKSLF